MANKIDVWASAFKTKDYTAASSTKNTTLNADCLQINSATLTTKYNISDIIKQVGATVYTYTFPTKTGTFALTSDIPSISATERTAMGSGITADKVKQIQTNADNIAKINTSLSGLTGAMHFIGVSSTDPKGTGGATVEGHTTFKDGDVCLWGTKEFIYNSASTNKWIELGDEGDHLTKAQADTYYVPLGRTIAGVALSKNITKEEFLKAINVADGATNVTSATVAGWGFTKNTGTVTAVKMNGTQKSPTNGVVDLGTVITAHQSLAGKQDKLTFDSTPTANSNNPVYSKGIKTYVDTAVTNVTNKLYRTTFNIGNETASFDANVTEFGITFSIFNGDNDTELFEDMTVTQFCTSYLQSYLEKQAIANWEGVICCTGHFVKSNQLYTVKKITISRTTLTVSGITTDGSTASFDMLSTANASKKIGGKVTTEKM